MIASLSIVRWDAPRQISSGCDFDSQRDVRREREWNVESRKHVRNGRDSRRQLRELVDAELITIGPKEAAGVARGKMRKRNVRHLLVVENDQPLGILSEHSLGGSNRRAAYPHGQMVEDLMTPGVAKAESTTTLSSAASLIHGREASSLLVTNRGRPMGIVTASDVFEELSRDPMRAPFPGWLPRGAKRDSGTNPQPVPAHIRVLGTELDESQRKYIRQELGTRLGKFSDSIERVTVRVEDANGPRGGVDQVCRIKVVLSNLPSMIFESQNVSLNTAVGEALAGAERVVRRTLQRRRMKPIKIGARSSQR